MVQESDLIVVAAVREIDERAGLADKRALTRVTLDVAEVLLGSLESKQLEIVLRGGELPDGTLERRSTVPILARNDRYVLFLKTRYYAAPFIDTNRALLRVVRYEDRELVVDAHGNGVLASAQHGLVRLRRVAASMRERAIAEARARIAGDALALESASDDTLSLEDAQFTVELSELLPLLRQAVASSGRAGAVVSGPLQPEDASPQLGTDTATGSVEEGARP